MNLLSATVCDTVTSLSDIYNSMNTVGGIAFLSQGIQTEITIHNCTFSNNSASTNHEDDLNQLFFKENGRGTTHCHSCMASCKMHVHVVHMLMYTVVID